MNGADDLEGRIFTSDEAKTFLQMVTKGFYSRSYLGLWMYEVIGREWDDLRDWAEGLKNEINPQTCTWSIAIWEWVYGFEPDESLSLEYRRQRIMSRIRKLRPINPEAVRRGVAGLIGAELDDVEVHDFVAPYTFEVFMRTYGTRIPDQEVLRYLNEIKPSHLAIHAHEEAVRVFRLELTLSFGGAIGTEQKHEPVPVQREFPLDQKLSFGAHGYTHTRTDLIGKDRTVREDIVFSHAAAYGQEIQAHPQGKDRSTETLLTVSSGGYARGHGDGEPVPPEHAARSTEGSAGNFYTRTHLKTKIIKEDEQNGR